jgi:hypothetical protein
MSRTEFVSLANAVCREVQAGGPPPLIAQLSTRALQPQATAALPVARRVSTSLRRVGVRTSRETSVGPVVRSYGRLIGLYSRAAVGAKESRSLVKSIRVVEQRIELDARRAGVPVCAGGGP